MTVLVALAAAPVANADGSPRWSNLSHFDRVTAPIDATKQKTLARDLSGKLGIIRTKSGAAHCTAFCLSPSLVATAGHCLHQRQGTSVRRRTGLQFHTVGTTETRSEVSWKNRATPILGLISGGSEVSLRPPIGAGEDWAILKLRNPVCKKGGLDLVSKQDSDFEPSKSPPIWTTKYNVSGDVTVAAHPIRCPHIDDQTSQLPEAMKSDFADPEHLIFHHCPTGPMASGTPMMIETETGPRVVGMHVGTYVRSRIYQHNNGVLQRLSTRPVTNIAVKSSVFARPIADLIRKRAGAVPHPNRGDTSVSK